jgi:hypothetical protein
MLSGLQAKFDRALENYASSHRRGPDRSDDLLPYQPQSRLDLGGANAPSSGAKPAGVACTFPARHLWRVLLRRLRIAPAHGYVLGFSRPSSLRFTVGPAFLAKRDFEVCPESRIEREKRSIMEFIDGETVDARIGGMLRYCEV